MKLGQFVMVLESQDIYLLCKILMKQLTSQQNAQGAHSAGRTWVDIDLTLKWVL